MLPILSHGRTTRRAPTHGRPRRVLLRVRRVLAGSLLLAVSWPPLGTPAAQPASEAPPAPRRKRAMDTQVVGIPRPGGLAYSSDLSLFVVLPVPEEPSTRAPAATLMNTFGEPEGTVALPVPTVDPRALAYDARFHRLLALDVAQRALYAIPTDASGRLEPARSVRLEAPRAGLLRPAGMAVDPASGEVFVLDRPTRRILRFTPAGASPAPDEPATIPEVRWIPLAGLAAFELSGLAFDPARRHLFTLSVAEDRLYEVAEDGRVMATHDISGVALSDPRSLVFAPSGDQTDDPSAASLYVADAGTPGGRGRVLEVTWATAGARLMTAAAALTGTLVRTTLTSQFSPPSPDPSGITYDSSTGRLVVSDGEVEEMSIWAGRNVFETSRSGSLIRSYNVTWFSNEPTGTAYNAGNLHMFFTDDDARKLFELDPGADRTAGTSDDRVARSFSTSAFGSGDPEGVAYDRANNRLFIADGVNEEIYIVLPGRTACSTAFRPRATTRSPTSTPRSWE